jgi:hypothetical protein
VHIAGFTPRLAFNSGSASPARPRRGRSRGIALSGDRQLPHRSAERSLRLGPYGFWLFSSIIRNGGRAAAGFGFASIDDALGNSSVLQLRFFSTACQLFLGSFCAVFAPRSTPCEKSSFPTSGLRLSGVFLDAFFACAKRTVVVVGPIFNSASWQSD